MLAALLSLTLTTGCPPAKPYDDGASPGDGTSGDGPRGGDVRVADQGQGSSEAWAASYGASVVITVGGLALDDAGNAYLAGHFSNKATLGAKKLYAAGGTDLYLAKVDPGGKLLWAREYGGANTDQLLGLARDKAGALYLTGRYYKQTTLGKITLTTAGKYEVYVARLSASGDVTWAVSAGGSGEDWGRSVAADGKGGCVVAGHFTGQAKFGGHSLSSAGSSDGFVARLDSAGKFSWAHRVGGPKADQAHAVGLDGAGNSYLLGHYIGSATLGGLKLSSANGSSKSDLLLARLGPGGKASWLKSAGGAGRDEGRALAVNAQGLCHLTGSFEKVAWFGAHKVGSEGAGDVFIARYDASGKALWATAGGGSSADNGVGLALDQQGRAYVTGEFLSSSVSFGQTKLTRLGNEDVFVAGLDPTGKPSWARSAGGIGMDWGTRVAVSADGKQLLAAGRYLSATAGFGKTDVSLAGNLMGAFLWRVAR